MSGGSFEYKYLSLDIYDGQLEDKELNELLEDFKNLLHDLEWYKSSDTSKEDYQETVKRFKGKWLKQKKAYPRYISCTCGYNRHRSERVNGGYVIRCGKCGKEVFVKSWTWNERLNVITWNKMIESEKE